MRLKFVLLLLLLLPGCRLVTAGNDAVEVYSRADIDAINARMQCRNMARTLVQIARCETGR